MKKHAVILPSRHSKTFDRFALPDGSTVLAVDARAHARALAAADAQLGKAMKIIKKNIEKNAKSDRTAA